MKKKTVLLVIDPQVDFCDLPGSALPVPGADADMKRLARFVGDFGNKLSKIHVTLDSHQPIDIAHPTWWQNSIGEEPAPYTIISSKDVEDGKWTPKRPDLYDRSLEYVRQLEASGKYLLFIWPEHCVIGTPGHNIHPDLAKAIHAWSKRKFATINHVAKGSNPFTEHYGGLQAEVPDPEDPSTSLNTEFLRILAEADEIFVAGEALSHCVKETVTQIADNIGTEHISKFRILTDCSSPVPAVPGGPDFPAIASDWLNEMERRGMKLVKTTDYMKGN